MQGRCPVKQRPTVVHLIDGLTVGGAESVLERLVSDPAAPPEHTHVIAFMRAGEILARMQQAGIPVQTLGLPRRRVSLGAFLRLRRLLREIRPDLLMSWSPTANVVAVFAARLCGRPRVVWNIRRAALDPAGCSRITALANRLCARLSRGMPLIVANAASGRRAHEGLGYCPKAWELMPNGFDTTRFQPDVAARADVRAALGIGPDAPLIGIAGRDNPVKDHATFLRAAALLGARRKDVHFLMVGGGLRGMRELLLRDAPSLVAAKRLHVLGVREDMPHILAALDLFTLTSLSEGFPNVLGEAMACSVPCVTTRTAGDGPMLVGDSGVVVPPGAPVALSQAWEGYLSAAPAEQRRLQKAARTRILDGFTVDRMRRRYAELYERLVGGEAGGVPSVAIVGTIDVDARIDLMRRLRPDFAPRAIGSTPGQRAAFAAAGFDYTAVAMSRKASPIADWRSYRALVRELRRSRPDVVHTYDTKPCVWARLAARAAGVPVVVGTITGRGTLYANGGLFTRLVRLVYEPLQRRASHLADMTLFYNSEDLAEFTARGVVPRDRAGLVHGSGVRCDRFRRESITSADCAAFRREIGVGEKDVVVTVVARVCRSKGVLEFAEAADRLSAADACVRCVLVGPADHDAWDHLSPAELDRLRRAVIWIAARDDIETVLAASDIAVLPTYLEGMPRALIEAAAMGLPLVATDVPGCREIVRPGVNGTLVPKQDPAALANAILTLIRDPGAARAYACASRAIAVEEFDLAAVANEIRGIYSACLERFNHRATHSAAGAARSATLAPSERPMREAAHEA